jgi:hypothetical protein
MELVLRIVGRFDEFWLTVDPVRLPVLAHQRSLPAWRLRTTYPSASATGWQPPGLGRPIEGDRLTVV